MKNKRTLAQNKGKNKEEGGDYVCKKKGVYQMQ